MADKKLNRPDQFDDLSLPDMESSWQKMKVLLDKEEKKKPLVPFIVRSAGVLLLLLLSGAGVWYMVKDNNGEAGKNKTQQYSNTPNRNTTTSTTKNEVTNQTENKSAQTKITDTNSISKIGLPKEDIDNSANNKTQITDSVNKRTNLAKSSDKQKTNTKSRKRLPYKISNNITQATTTNDQDNSEDQKDMAGKTKTLETPITKSGDDKVDSLATVNKLPGKTGVQQMNNVDSSPKDSSNKALTKTSNDITTKDTAIKITGSAANTKLAPRNKNRFLFSAGIGLQQQIPLSGQKHIAYNTKGRKSGLSDYTPSVYLRFEKNSKWFIQAEFRYAAPQAVKDFSYSRKTTFVDSARILTTTNSYLKKTYYHQLPVSFNYYVAPNLSVGTGIIYNRFQGAVSEREVSIKNFGSLLESGSTQITTTRNFTDTFFFKTQLQYLLQAEYHVKRFTFGLRFTNDLEPYIKFTKPDGEVVSKKNRTVQAMVRWRFFSSKK